MGLALLFYALPFGIGIGFILGLLNRKSRRIAFALQAILFLIGILLISTDDSNLSGDSFTILLIFLGIPPSILTMFIIGKVKGPFKSLIIGIKKSDFLRRNSNKILIVMLLFLGLYIGKSMFDKHNMNKLLVGKWYGKEEAAAGYKSNMILYEFDEHGNGTESHFPYETHESIPTNSIVRLSDTEMKLVFQSSLFFEDDATIITKVDSITDNFYSGSIIQESKFFNDKVDEISESELISFWQQNVIPIINFDEGILLNRSNSYLVMSEDFNGVFENEKDVYTLKKTFSEELRTGLQRFNYNDINQIEMDKRDVILAIYFAGRNYFKPYGAESPIECYTHFGLFFAKNGKEWNLISMQEVPDCQDYNYNNHEPKKYENLKIIEIRDFMIRRAIEFYLWNYINDEIFTDFINLDKNRIANNFNFPLQINERNYSNNNVEIALWEREDLLKHYKAFFGNEFIERVTELKKAERNGSLVKEDLGNMIYEFDVYSPTKFKGQIYNRKYFKLASVDNNWKLISLELSKN